MYKEQHSLPSVTYVSHREVEELLFELMKKVLSPRDLEFLLDHCGYLDGNPHGPRELAARYALTSTAHARNTLRRVIVVVRRAIPTSPLAPLLRNFSVTDEKSALFH